MSRTDKDRPYWVRSNDPTLLRDEHHNHTLFGKPEYTWAVVKDEKGEPVYEDIFHTKIIRISTGIVVPSWYYGPRVRDSIYDLFSPYNSQGKLKAGYREETVFVRRQKKRERVIKFVYPERCTIDDGNVSGYYWNTGLTCYRNLTTVSYRDVSKEFRQQRQGRERRRTRDVLHRMTLEANSFEEEDFDDTYAPVEYRQHDGWD